jgi:hypothetical protein
VLERAGADGTLLIGGCDACRNDNFLREVLFRDGSIPPWWSPATAPYGVSNLAEGVSDPMLEE